MRWLELLFAHWIVPVADVRPLIPAALQLDLFESRCYVGAVPFLMENVGPRYVPPLPGLHAFPELNLRTYVTAGGKPGVWFFSLDAGQKLAVRVARKFFHLPYFDAKFDIDLAGGAVAYNSVRTHKGAAPARFSATYRAAGPVYEAEAGSLDAWLTDRYCLYSADDAGQSYRCEISHSPWPLQKAEAIISSNTLGEGLGIDLRHPPAALHFAKRLDVKAWMLQNIS
ncbi:MAG: DUF2071 domain-containing protein [Acidobacteriota bacterium]|nr:DUF2071 domain-containing protein [Acidobacteriota bacterium]